MKTRQKSVRVFEIITDDYDKLVNFVEKKYVFLKRFLLVVKSNNEKIKQFLKKSDLEVRFVSENFDGSNEEFEEYQEIKIVEKIIHIPQKVVKVSDDSTNTQIFDRIIRSGFEIETDKKLVFLQRINAGAKIYSSKEIEIFAEVLGNVRCDGDYMIVKKAKKGAIIFNNEPLDEINELTFISKKGKKELI